MAGRIDLHIHTQASADGVYSPREIFDMARRAGLRAIAFADHNSTESCDEGDDRLRVAGSQGQSLASDPFRGAVVAGNRQAPGLGPGGEVSGVGPWRRHAFLR